MTVGIRAVRVAVAAGALAVFGAIALFVPVIRDSALEGMARVCPSSREPVTLLPVDFALILEAVLAHRKFEGMPPPPLPGQGSISDDARKPVVLSNESLVVCAGSSWPSVENNCPSSIDDEIMIWPGADFRIPKRMRLQLAEANRNAVVLPRFENPYVILESQATIRSAVANGGRVWSTFYSKYPGTSGYLKVSLPILSEDRTWAVILVEHYCGGLCGTGELYLLMRGPLGWSVVVTDGIWIS